MGYQLKYILILGIITGFSFVQRKVTIFLAGDSTMSIKADNKRPETGWGMPFASFFNNEVIVDNRAANGRSTRTFIAEGKWSKLINDLKEGDYVMIQFGHNDQSKEKEDRYTSPQDFKINLEKFVTEVKAKNATPILLTPIARRRFDEQGNFYDVHGEYPQIVRTVAKEQQVVLIDLHAKTIEAITKLGKDASTTWFLHLKAGENNNYPNGVTDNTHLNEEGALQVALMVKQSLKELHIDLSKKIKN